MNHLILAWKYLTNFVIFNLELLKIITSLEQVLEVLEQVLEVRLGLVSCLGAEMYKVPHNLIFFPKFLFFNLDFLPQNFRPFPLFPT